MLKTAFYFSGIDHASITRFGFKEAIVRLCKKKVNKLNFTTASGVYQLFRPDYGKKYASHTEGIVRKNLKNIYSPLIKIIVKVYPKTDHEGPGGE
jgi:hypothetical protein